MVDSYVREPRLPFPTKPLVINGVKLEEYIIPDKRKAEVLKQLYVFIPLPSLDEERLDIHSGKRFKIREFRVTREGNRNWLVSPYYEEGGGPSSTGCRSTVSRTEKV